VLQLEAKQICLHQSFHASLAQHLHHTPALLI